MPGDRLLDNSKYVIPPSDTLHLYTEHLQFTPNESGLFPPCKRMMSKATRCCKHPTESPRRLNPSFQSRMFTAPPGCQQQTEEGPKHHNFTSRRRSYLTFGGLQVIAWHDVNQEVKLVKLRNGHGNVVPLWTQECQKVERWSHTLIMLIQYMRCYI